MERLALHLAQQPGGKDQKTSAERQHEPDGYTLREEAGDNAGRRQQGDAARRGEQHVLRQGQAEQPLVTLSRCAHVFLLMRMRVAVEGKMGAPVIPRNYLPGNVRAAVGREG